MLKPLGKNVLVKREAPEYSGLIQGVGSEDSAYGKVLGIGIDVTIVENLDKVIVDWSKAKNVKGDLFSVHENDIIAILED